jgi:hypothetical protein
MKYFIFLAITLVTACASFAQNPPTVSGDYLDIRKHSASRLELWQPQGDSAVIGIMTMYLSNKNGKDTLVFAVVGMVKRDTLQYLQAEVLKNTISGGEPCLSHFTFSITKSNGRLLLLGVCLGIDEFCRKGKPLYYSFYQRESYSSTSKFSAALQLQIDKWLDRRGKE